MMERVNMNDQLSIETNGLIFFLNLLIFHSLLIDPDNIFLSIILNTCFGCSKEPSH